jgi:hypothetical protein
VTRLRVALARYLRRFADKIDPCQPYTVDFAAYRSVVDLGVGVIGDEP